MFLKRDYTQWQDLLGGFFCVAILIVLIWLSLKAF